jgi:hypothetical protein
MDNTSDINELVPCVAGIVNIDSPLFKEWFGDSKVVDSEGKPLVVYHGTNSEFSEFDISKSGNNHFQGEHAFHFISEKATADNYAIMASGITGVSGKAITMAVYLSLENPLVVRASDKYAAIEHYDDNLSGDVFSYQADGYDGVLIKYDKGIYVVAFDSTQIKLAGMMSDIINVPIAPSRKIAIHDSPSFEM